jgi:radical SAM protein with 4Fe4S-binding SPASM domain
VHDGGRLRSGVCTPGTSWTADVVSSSETEKRGFKTVDGVHMAVRDSPAPRAPSAGGAACCPGFTGERALATGHIDEGQESRRAMAGRTFDTLAAWKQCGDCAFIPVCAGGCSVASHAEGARFRPPRATSCAAESSTAHSTQ